MIASPIARASALRSLACLALLSALPHGAVSQTLETCGPRSLDPSGEVDDSQDTHKDDISDTQRVEAWKNYTANAAEALGTIADIPLYQRLEGRHWSLLSGKFLKITVDGEIPSEFIPHMRSDRPMQLPTDYTGATTPQGQSVPYAAIGRPVGSNPEVQWVFLARHYQIRAQTDPDFDKVSDIALIGHHRRTGATAFFQYYRPNDPIKVPRIPSPFGAEGPGFWKDVPWIADIDCAQCHGADPFVHSPYITQAKADYRLNQPYPEPIVPANPLGPLWYIDATITGANGDKTSLFAPWEKNLFHLDAPSNTCTTCHRISNSDPLRLYPESTHGAGLSDEKWKDPCQTDAFQRLPWMPPVSLAYGDYYEDQPTDLKTYLEDYGNSATAVNRATRQASELTKNATGLDSDLEAKLKELGFARNPAPPEGQRMVMVERDEQDRIAAGESLVIVDTRMTANTGTSLEEWRFVGAASAGADVEAIPVVLRGLPPREGAAAFRIIARGKARGAESAGDWVAFGPQGTVAVASGDYLGLILSNTGAETAKGLVPYSDDEWAEVTDASGAKAYPLGLVTYLIDFNGTPPAGVELNSPKPDYRTYSFEFRSRL